MAVLKWKHKDSWKTLYESLLSRFLLKDNHLSDLPNKKKARDSLELSGDNITSHYHDDRYLPLIEENKALIESRLGSLLVKVTGSAKERLVKPNNKGLITIPIEDVKASKLSVQEKSHENIYLVGTDKEKNGDTLYNAPLYVNKDTEELVATRLYADTIHAKKVVGDKVYGAVWNDYAEFFEKGEETSAGDLIALNTESDAEVYRRGKLGDTIVGVHTDEFAHIIGGQVPPPGEDFLSHNLKTHIPVALMGRVHVHITGPSKKGAFVAPSSVPGCAEVFDPKKHRCMDAFGILLEEDTRTDTRRLRVKLRC